MKNNFFCLYCNKYFVDKKHPNRKFCSKKCVSNYYSGKLKIKNILKICVICGEEFKVNKEHALAMKCSDECRLKARKLNGTLKKRQEEYRKNHKGRIRKANHKWYEKYKERILARAKIWRQTNPNYKRYRKARRYGTGQRLSIKTVQRVYEDNIKNFGTLTCALCNKVIEFGKDSIDHKLPLSRGGSNLYENLQIAHKSCNYSKQNKTMEEWEVYRNLIGTTQ